MTQGFQPPPPAPGNESPAALYRHGVALASAVARLFQGKMNNTGTFTCTANVATTVLSDPRLTVNSVLTLDPKTANAAAEKAAGTIYALTANRNNLTWTITHANAATTDRTFQYAIIG
jgi:hypothetical protein